MKKYLKANVKFEPLIYKWYAWGYIIPPLSAAANIEDRYISTMKSFVKFPKIHIQANSNPDLMGGPFLDLGLEQIDDIKQLIIDTEEKCQELLNLNKSVKELNKVLKQNANGGSLEHLYEQIPDMLRGCVELVYDVNNNASTVFIEEFIYSKYYNDKHQEIMLSVCTDDNRSFVLSTPRISINDEILLKIPFKSHHIDELVKAKTTQINVNELAEELNLGGDQKDKFINLFQDDITTKTTDAEFTDDGVRLRFFGHACVLMQTKNTNILIDPVISYPMSGDKRFTFHDLPEHIDYVLLSHNHQDHILFETLLQLRHKIGTIIVPRNRKGAIEDPSLKLILNKIGFKHVISLDIFETSQFSDGEIMGLPFFGEHADLNIQSKLTYYVSLNGKKILLAADSNNLDKKLYDNIFSEIGKMDVLFIGMECEGAPLSWLYAPYMTTPITKEHDESRTLSGSNFEKAWNIVQKSKCKEAYVYAMGLEPWLTYIMALQYTPESIQITESDKLISMCREKGIVSERLFMKKEWII